MLPRIRTAIEKIDPTLLFLQEVQGEHKRREKRIADWPEGTQVDFMSEALWPHRIYGKNAVYTAGHHGNAILSKFELLTTDNINVANTQRASRSLLHAVIQAEKTSSPIHLLCVHLGLFEAERQEQVKKLSELIEARVPQEAPLLMAGDFNDWRRGLSCILEERLALREVFKQLQGDFAKTYPALRPALRTDRIYYRGLELQTGHCLHGNPWNILSDHLPLYAAFRLKS